MEINCVGTQAKKKPVCKIALGLQVHLYIGQCIRRRYTETYVMFLALSGTFQPVHLDSCTNPLNPKA